MNNIHTPESFAFYIVEVVLGTDFEGSSSKIKLITASRERAFDKALALFEELDIKDRDYGLVTVSGGDFDSSMEPMLLFQSNVIKAEEYDWECDTQIDATTALSIETPLSQSDKLKMAFAQVNIKSN